MAFRIPFQPSVNNQRINIPLDGARYLFDAHWNSVDTPGAWYFDIRQEDETPILVGFKVVLQSTLAKSSTHPFFDTHYINIIDTSNDRRDAGFDDLGARIQVEIITPDDQLPAPS